MAPTSNLFLDGLLEAVLPLLLHGRCHAVECTHWTNAPFDGVPGWCSTRLDAPGRSYCVAAVASTPFRQPAKSGHSPGSQVLGPNRKPKIQILVKRASCGHGREDRRPQILANSKDGSPRTFWLVPHTRDPRTMRASGLHWRHTRKWSCPLRGGRRERHPSRDHPRGI